MTLLARPRRRWEAEAGVADGPAVAVANFLSIDHALKAFARRFEKAGILTELRRREHARSRGQLRRWKTSRARAREARARRHMDET